MANNSASFDETYRDLRQQALDVDGTALAGAADLALFGLVMDIGYPDAVATLVGLADGTTSVYVSNGGGAIGGGSHPTVADATRRWIAIGVQLLPKLQPASTVGFPGDDATQLTAITPTGWRVAEAQSSVFGSGTHDLSPLFIAGHAVISEFRAVPESGLG